jgi:hypothetical protein
MSRGPVATPRQGRKSAINKMIANMETGKEEVGSVTDGCLQLTVWLKESARYEELRRNLILNPDNKATVVWDFNKRDIVIVN